MPYPDRFYPVVDSLAWVERLTQLGVGTIQLRVVMGGNAKRQPGLADRRKVGIGQIFLAEMQMFGAGDDGGAPVIVNHEFG